jgi:hypothetical protein
VSLARAERDDDGLQDTAFAPGSRLCLRPEPTDEDRNRIQVVGASDLLHVGLLPDQAAARVGAALEHGLEQAALTIWERRNLATGDRVGLRILIYSSAMALVRVPKRRLVDVERFPERRRVVLAVERDGGLHWWDPTTTVGPLAVDGLGLSSDLVDDLGAGPLLAPARQRQRRRGPGLLRRVGGEHPRREGPRAVAAHPGRAGAGLVVGWKPPGARRAIYDEPVCNGDDIPF